MGRRLPSCKVSDKPTATFISPNITRDSVTSPSLSPPPLTTAVAPAHNIEAEILSLLERLPPTHPIFGPPTVNLVRLPLRSPGRANGQCWAKVAQQISGWVRREMRKEDIRRDNCWMSQSAEVQITRTRPGSTRVEVLRKIVVVRLLAFLLDPTDASWTKLCASSSDPAGSRPIDSPFSHRCGRGLRREGQEAVCINGLHHGRLATRQENESHKACGNGALALCPGHGAPPVKCIFTNPDGTIRPCRMREDCVPACACSPRCFG